jgi:type VI secretion system secreted protein VgrG
VTATYTQVHRPLQVKTPLGDDRLLAVGFSGSEEISRLFHFQLDLLAENDNAIAFDQLLGQPVTLRLDLPGDAGQRYFSGLCSRVSQGGRDPTFTSYHLEIVPKFWLLTRRAQSRIFQHLTVPDILNRVLEGLEVAFQLQGSWQPRDYCVQYRESDFNFASRLMEEEGIYYFFKHEAGSHTLVLANTPQSHPFVPERSTIVFEEVFGGKRYEDRVLSWRKVQELRSGKYVLWDHCFELPHKHLEADRPTQDAVQVGQVSHHLHVGGNDRLEVYDYPGEYAQRFDGIDKGGAEQPAELQKIFDDNQRTVGIRMQQEAAAGLAIEGTSTCRQFTSGHKFTLTRHFNADGPYVLTAVEHTASLSVDYRSGESGQYRYQNRFKALPLALPYRPPRQTPKPFVQGTQTAVVVGPKGEEIFTDKYGRVKVQFHWDREGKNNADSASWVRVGTPWAGKQWGMIHIPRIGQEVIVAFQEGDPDQPIIVGSVYNAEMMPPYELPDNMTQSGVKTRSSLNGTPANFNEIRFEDKKGGEQLFIHAEKNQDIEVENDETHWVGHDRGKTIDHDEITHVKHDRTETVDNNETITVHGNRSETVDKDELITIHSNRTEIVDKDECITIGQSRTENVGKDEDIVIAGSRTKSVGENESLDVGKALAITAGESITLKTGSASITMKKDGTITIKGKNITVQGSGEMVVKANKNITMKGKKILQN